MSMIPITIAALLALVTVDRVLLWCERRGSIYYRRSPRMRHGGEWH